MSAAVRYHPWAGAGGGAAGLRLAALCAVLLLGVPHDASGQLIKRVKERAKQRVENAAVGAVDKAADATGRVIRCLVTDEECARRARADGKAVELVDTEGNVVSPASADSVPAAATLPADDAAWTNYDFRPGERVLFTDDFTADVVGDFPRRLEFRSGQMQVVEWHSRRWLSAEKGELYVELPEVLPERFTMEFELAGRGNPMSVTFDGGPVNRAPGRLSLGTDGARLHSGDVNAVGAFGLSTARTPVTIRIAVDGRYLKLYANERRVLNVPNADLGRSDRIYVHMNGWSAEEPRLITDVRIAAGGNDLYDALEAAGRVATQGILFDTGSERIRPESTPTLTVIADMLRQHPDLQLLIEGHTDSVGDDTANLALSERRAHAILEYLVQRHQIDAARLTSAGMGESRPVTGNDTPEGRQQNRRVELVRR